MLIQHKQSGNRGFFFIQPDGEEILAELTYVKHDAGMLIDHTEVDESLQGQNIGYQLVSTAVEYARSHHLKVIPACVFAKAVIDKKPELQDVLDNGESTD
jgi:predicted GNAT family acetyltransferase